jgi:hypothetical protein
MKIGAGISSRITGAQRGALVYKKENPPTLRYYEALRAKDPDAPPPTMRILLAMLSLFA